MQLVRIGARVINMDLVSDGNLKTDSGGGVRLYHGEEIVAEFTDEEAVAVRWYLEGRSLDLLEQHAGARAEEAARMAREQRAVAP